MENEVLVDILLEVLEKKAFMCGERLLNEEFILQDEDFVKVEIDWQEELGFLSLVASRGFLEEVTKNMLGEMDESSEIWPELCSDVAGEILNIVVGNYLALQFTVYNVADLRMPRVSLINKLTTQELILEKPSFITIFEGCYPVILFKKG